MFRLPVRPHRLLRLSGLVLLVLSLLVRPMLEQLGGTHAAEHATLAAGMADPGHDAGHGPDPDPRHGGQDHAGPDPARDPGHVQGLHGLMHQAECGATAALSSAWRLALARPVAGTPPAPDTSAPKRGLPVTPFRPPIA